MAYRWTGRIARGCAWLLLLPSLACGPLSGDPPAQGTGEGSGGDGGDGEDGEEGDDGHDGGTTGTPADNPRALDPWGCEDWDFEIEPCHGEAVLPHGWVAKTADDLAVLQGVRCVQGTLELDNYAAADLEPLASLEVVCGEIKMYGADVESLGGLRNLRAAHELYLWANDALVSLAGLEQLTYLHAGLRIDDNEQLASLDALSGLETVPGVTIADSTLIDSLGPLAQRSSFDDRLIVRGMEALTSLELPAMQRAGVVRIEANPALVTVGLGPLADAEVLLVSDNPRLEAVTSGGQLTQVGSLEIANDPQLSDVSALQGLGTVGDVRIAYVPMLEELGALAGLTAIEGSVYLRDTGVVSLEPLSQVASVADRITVILNPALPSALAHAWADGFAAVGRKVAGNLGDDIPIDDPCPWPDDGECDAEYNDLDNESGTGLCDADPIDCEHAEPPD